MYLVFSNSYPVLVCREAGLPSKIETLLWKKVFLASSRLRFWALLSIYFSYSTDQGHHRNSFNLNNSNNSLNNPLSSSVLSC